MARDAESPDPTALTSQQPQLVLGLVSTDLLNVAEPLPLQSARQALELVPGISAMWRKHPVQFVVSPDRFFGVDCKLPTAKGGPPRGIGTVRVRAVLTEGHVLQGSARADVVVGASSRRLPWAHYAAHVGVIETINNADPEALADGFLESGGGGGRLDLTGLASYVMAMLNDVSQTESRARLKTETVRLFWVVHTGEFDTPQAEVWIGDDGVFRARFTAPFRLVPQIAEFCEILGLHLWLLSALRIAFERASRTLKPMTEFEPVLSYLGHIWNPKAHLPAETAEMWEALDQAAQLDWEWETMLRRIRDNVSLLTPKAIEETLHKEFA